MPPPRSTQSQLVQEMHKLLMEKVPELAISVNRLMEKVDQSISLSQENNRTLRGHNGQEGLLGRVSQIERSTSVIPGLECTIELVKSEQDKISLQFSNHLSTHSEDKLRMEKFRDRKITNKDKIWFIIFTALVSGISSLITTGILYLADK